MKIKLLAGVFAVAMALSCAQSEAVPLTYDVNRTIGVDGSVVGTITTDGFLGAWGSTNHIVNWSLTITDSVGSAVLTGPFTSAGHDLGFANTAMSSTEAAIYFDFNNDGYLLFQPNLFSGLNFWCLQTQQFCANLGGITEVLRTSHFGAIASASPSGNAIIATRGTSVVPLPAALPLLGSGLAVFGLVGLRRRGRG